MAQAVFQNGLTEGIQRNAPGLPAQIFINSGASQIKQVLAQLNATQYTTDVLTAYLDGLRNSYFISVACAAAAFLAACGLSWKRIEKRKVAAAGTEGAAEMGEPRKDVNQDVTMDGQANAKA